MYAKLVMELKSEKALSIHMSSLFHGAIMDLIPRDYADVLHVSEIKPFTIHLEKREGVFFLVCSTLNQQAYTVLIENLLMHLSNFHIKHHNLDVQIIDKKLFKQEKQMLAKSFYNQDCSRIVEIEFLTATAFKQNGEYVFFPDVRLIYQSLMNKYDAMNQKESFFDVEVLEKLCETTKITGYALRSTHFHLEGVKIPAFLGKLRLKILTNQTMVNFANVLFEYGRYSGIGIKSSLGMGAIELKIGGMKDWNN